VILIITHKEDFTADFVIDKLNSRDIPYFRLNCEDITKYNYTFNSGENFNFQIDNISFYSLWFRRTKLPNIEMENSEEKLFILDDYNTLLENILSTINVSKWLSKPFSVYQAENKIYQLKVAQNIGFKIPNTLVTSDHSCLRRFIDIHRGSVIIKPIRQGRIRKNNEIKTIFTNQIDSETIQNLEEYALTPCIFQESIEKDLEIRITVVDNSVFSASVESQITEETKTDWRKRKLSFERYSLPHEISAKCIELTKRLNLSFGAIDMIKKPDGEYIFLEINPNGQWAWIEMETGLEISDKIIRFLTQ
jgi:glutathione synthase/RimK-type ligase-like ATP-grasp enzyme